MYEQQTKCTDVGYAQIKKRQMPLVVAVPFVAFVLVVASNICRGLYRKTIHYHRLHGTGAEGQKGTLPRTGLDTSASKCPGFLPET